MSVAITNMLDQIKETIRRESQKANRARILSAMITASSSTEDGFDQEVFAEIMEVCPYVKEYFEEKG